MQLHQLKPHHKRKSRKRVGRGGKRGTYSGRGLKGQKSRSGSRRRLGFAGGDTTLFKRLPKKRGSVGAVAVKKGSKLGRKLKPVILNLDELENKLGKTNKKRISAKDLLEKGLVGKIKGRIPPIKILGRGELKKKFEFQGLRFSKSAQDKLGRNRKTPESKLKSK